MNTLTKKQLFGILKSFIYDEIPDTNGDFNWDEIFYYARIHSLSGIVGYVITKYSLCKDPVYAQKFEKLMINHYGYQYRRNKQMKRLIAVLNDNEIDHLLMKGYVMKDMYPIPELRSYGDIDFVIRKEDRDKTDQLMKQLGYESHENWEPVYSYKKDTEFYEIHTEMLDSEINDGKQREYFHDYWKHSLNVNQHTYVLNPDYHFLYLIAHLAKHASSRGAGLRMYLDIAIYIRQYRNTMNWDFILNQLEILNLNKFFCTVCTLCKLWFSVDPPCDIETIDQDAIDQFTEITLKGGTFGFHDSNNAITVLKESHDKSNKLKTIISQIFPPANEIQARYTYLQKHKWLLPMAWIDRVVRNRKLIGMRVNTAREIIQLDNHEIERIQNLNEKIGL